MSSRKHGCGGPPGQTAPTRCSSYGPRLQAHSAVAHVIQTRGGAGPSPHHPDHSFLLKGKDLPVLTSENERASTADGCKLRIGLTARSNDKELTSQCYTRPTSTAGHRAHTRGRVCAVHRPLYPCDTTRAGNCTPRVLEINKQPNHSRRKLHLQPFALSYLILVWFDMDIRELLARECERFSCASI